MGRLRLRVGRVLRGIRAMPACEKPRVSRGDHFCMAGRKAPARFYGFKTLFPQKIIVHIVIDCF